MEFVRKSAFLCFVRLSKCAIYLYKSRARVRVRDTTSADAVYITIRQSDRQQQRRNIFDYSKQDSKKANYSRRKLSCFGACSICFQMHQQRRAHQQRQQQHDGDSDSDRQQQQQHDSSSGSAVLHLHHISATYGARFQSDSAAPRRAARVLFFPLKYSPMRHNAK